jgi:hypothetical protein
LADKYKMDEEFSPEDPGNQLRAKLNGTEITQPKSFDEVLHTAQERGILDFRLLTEDAMTVVNLFFVARAIDMMPGDEAARIRL